LTSSKVADPINAIAIAIIGASGIGKRSSFTGVLQRVRMPTQVNRGDNVPDRQLLPSRVVNIRLPGVRRPLDSGSKRVAEQRALSPDQSL
jgi:hypothetical protein